MSVQVSYQKQTLLGIMLLLVLLLIIEGFAQLYDNFFGTDCRFTNSDAVKHLDIDIRKQICNDHNSVKYHNDELHTQIVPNQHFSTININEHGFRGPEFTKIKTENTFRIFVLGGSTAFSSGVTSDESTFSGFLQKKFESENLPINVEVINAGIPAVTSFTEHWLVKNKLIHFEPDLLIIYDGWNDVGKRLDNYGIPHSEHLKELQNKENSSFKNEQENTIYEILRDLWRSTKTRNIINLVLPVYLYNLGIYDIKSHDNTPVQTKVDVWKERWKEICELGRTNGFDVIVTLQPIAGSGNSTLTGEIAKMRYTLNNNEWVLERLEFYADSLSELDDYCTKTKDLRNVFDDINGPIFLDAGHVNDYGNEIVAQELFELTFPIVKERYS